MLITYRPLCLNCSTCVIRPNLANSNGRSLNTVFRHIMPGAGEKNKSAYQHFVHVTARAISCHIYSLVICSKGAAILLPVCCFFVLQTHRNSEIQPLEQAEHLPLKMPTSDHTVGPINMFALAEPIWRRVPSAGLVCWVSWRSCGGGSV